MALLKGSSSQQKLWLKVKHQQVPNPFYKLKYNVTIYDKFFYDVLVATMFPFTIYSCTTFPASTIYFNSFSLPLKSLDIFLCFPEQLC